MAPTDSRPLPASTSPSPEESEQRTEGGGDELKGFGGWLILLVLILLIIYPLQTIIGVAATTANLPWPNPLSSGKISQSVVYWILVSMLVSICLMCCGIYAGVKVLKIKRGAMRITKAFLGGVLAYNLAMFIVTLIAEHRGNKRLNDSVDAELRNVVFALFWYVYLEMSKRVAITYSDGRA